MEASLVGLHIGGKYELIAEKGRGCFGAVYRAVQHPVERVVAVKTLDPRHFADPDIRARFLSEARALARLDHPGIVTLHDFGEQAGRPYLVTEYISGRTLQKLIAREAPLPVGRVLKLAAHILDALAAAHEAGVVHRDLKPANIMVFRGADDEERIKLIDFGIAGSTHDRQPDDEIIGTPRYMAPEQTLSGRADARSDLYALGTILYEMLAGEPAFTGASVAAVMAAHRDARPAPFDDELAVPAAIEAFVQQALSKDPARRFPDARAMAEAARALGERYHAPATEPPAAPPPLDERDERPAIYLLPPIADDTDEHAPPVNPLAATATHHATTPARGLAPPRGLTSPPGLATTSPGACGDLAFDVGPGWDPTRRGSGPLPALVRATTPPRGLPASAAARGLLASEAPAGVPASEAPAPRGVPASEAPAHGIPASEAPAPGAPSAALEPAATAPAPPTTEPAAPLAAQLAACEPTPCWKRRCFWALVGLNIVACVAAIL